MTLRGTATSRAAAFRMDCSIRCDITASPDRIWALLTNAAEFPRWNSTVTSLTGQIALGERLELRGSLPDFRPAFETYAADLKRAAEGGV